MFEFKVEIFSQDWTSQFELGYFCSKQNFDWILEGARVGSGALC